MTSFGDGFKATALAKFIIRERNQVQKFEKLQDKLLKIDLSKLKKSNFCLHIDIR